MKPNELRVRRQGPTVKVYGRADANHPWELMGDSEGLVGDFDIRLIYEEAIDDYSI